MAFSVYDVLTIDQGESFLDVRDDTLATSPEISIIPSNPSKHLQYNATRIQADEATYVFRDIGEFKPLNNSLGENIPIQLTYADGTWATDVANPKGDFHGRDAQLALASSVAQKAMFGSIAKQIWNGTETGSDKGFAGILSFITANTGHTIGTPVTGGEAIFAVNLGDQFTSLSWGNNGQMEISEVSRTVFPGTTAGTGAGRYYQELGCWVGLQCQSVDSAAVAYSTVQDDSSTDTLRSTGVNDRLISQLMTCFQPANRRPPANPQSLWSPTGMVVPSGMVIFMSTKAWSELQMSRLAINPQGIPAPFPSSVYGIPIIETAHMMTPTTA